MGLKVAIIGLSPTTHDLAPWWDNTWERWGLPWDEGSWVRMHRLFEMHDMRLLKSEHCKRRDGYFDRLRECEKLYMQEAYVDIPNAIRYPFEDVEKTTGCYWNSSIAYAMALAIYEGAEEIALYGVDMKGDDEYGYQKPNMEYLIGLAIGRGIKVTVPDASPLLKFNATGVRFYDHMPVYAQRYGWLG
jgi:hypothetical protein